MYVVVIKLCIYELKTDSRPLALTADIMENLSWYCSLTPKALQPVLIVVHTSPCQPQQHDPQGCLGNLNSLGVNVGPQSCLVSVF